MYRILLVFTVFFEVVVAYGAVNYCGAKMCGKSNAHTFCQYREGASPLCQGYMEAPLSSEEKARILARLNRRRSDAARGLPRRPRAGDMLKLRWVEELSREAQRWADQCRPPNSPEDHDACRDLYSVSVGQCVASVVGEAPGLKPESLVDVWFMQTKLYTGNITFYTPKAQQKRYYQDFAQMMWSKTYMVGCGRSRFMADWRGRLRSVERLVCNFAPRGPQPGRPIWTPSEPGSMCPPRSKPEEISGLCAYQNDVNVSRDFKNSLPLHENIVLDTVFEIENNKSLDYLGSLDERCLTKMVIYSMTVTTDANVSFYYFNKSEEKREREKRDFENNEFDFGNNELKEVNVITEGFIKEINVANKKASKFKINIVGRPKPYDVDELNAITEEHNAENSQIQDKNSRNSEIDLYAEYGLMESEEGIVRTTMKEQVVIETIQDEHIPHSTIETKSEKYDDGSNLLNVKDKSITNENYLNISNEEMNVRMNENESIISDRIIEEYLADPETARALQDALELSERTLASSGPVSTPGKVRRELRNLKYDLQNVSSERNLGLTKSSVVPADPSKEENRNRTVNKGPLISMVLRYMPYLKPYEKSIIGEPSSDCDAIFCDCSVIIGGILFNVAVLL